MRRSLTFGAIFVAVIAIGLGILSRSSGQPAATQPAVNIAPEARQILNQVRDAYASLKSLAVSGTVAGRFDIDGVQSTNNGQFTGLYSSTGLFRSEMKDAGATTQPSGDLLLGNTGEKIYLFLPQRNRYQIIDAPRGKVDLSALGEDVADLLRNQDLSLALALAGDAAGELSQDASSILRVEDVKIDGRPFPAIILVCPRYDMTLVVDPQTHLLRRAVADLAKSARLQGAQNVKSALLTMEYLNAPAAGVDAGRFAWSPPPGAQLLTSEAPPSPLEGKPAPAFSLPGLDGKDVSAQGLKGSVFVLDFWATWCGPCVASLPHLDAIYKDFKPRGVKFFAVNVSEDKDTIQKFVNDTKISIPVLMDSDSKVCGAYDSIGGIPFTVVVGRDGTVLKAGFIGGNEDQIRPIIESALKK
jgi:thiol-disulfide isomerase/thioredoxin